MFPCYTIHHLVTNAFVAFYCVVVSLFFVLRTRGCRQHREHAVFRFVNAKRMNKLYTPTQKCATYMYIFKPSCSKNIVVTQRTLKCTAFIQYCTILQNNVTEFCENVFGINLQLLLLLALVFAVSKIVQYRVYIAILDITRLKIVFTRFKNFRYF